ncbi:hypothetical protein CAC42_5855 [Sphaceloma murrayae]|uniref:Apple domain-containing protein n=1 Tax=Sphaceloma murrayae TaxID=2082308 RepID=A0A2K1QZC9_9PEZI|nr:hypothetical protein CAC42_5855 [Sphaceloma murrayae]
MSIPSCVPSARAHVDSTGRVWKTYIPDRDNEVLEIDIGVDMWTIGGLTFEQCIDYCAAYRQCVGVEYSSNTCYAKSSASAKRATVKSPPGGLAAILTDSHVCITTAPAAIEAQDDDYKSSACSCLALPAPTKQITSTVYERTTVTTASFVALETKIATVTSTFTSYTATTALTQTRTLPWGLQRPYDTFQEFDDMSFEPYRFRYYTNAAYIPLDTVVMSVPCYPGADPAVYPPGTAPQNVIRCQDHHDCMNVCHVLNIYAGEGSCSSVTLEGGNTCVLHRFTDKDNVLTDAPCQHLTPSRLFDSSFLQEPLPAGGFVGV